ncbi:MAG: ABC-2 transporter permease [Candidatus Eisenbacteria bacterium]|uniref:ABC-2 transporter permease n=1 Tax=Eiseniibacteriota bacterium TaxID=2212470 RepID=A0A956N8Z1_UNCEI|nr:ABC-2 transporter permease [Candidatus Eisenbacteria bacterium]MCB9463463.1 ABC-2 transporter permease [Candidatus Eisenbacteria bacterium]
MIRQLLWKDAYLYRRVISLVLIVIGAGLALALAGRAMIGTTLILDVLIGLLFYLPVRTIVDEQRNRTAVFVLTLPVRPDEYAIAKALGNLALFLVPVAALWAVAKWVLPETAVGAGGSVLAFLHSGWIPGLLASSVMVFSAAVAVALVTKSTDWTVVTVLVSLFLIASGVFRFTPKSEAGRRWIEAVSNGDPTALIFVLTEIGVAAGVLLWAVRTVVRRGQLVD